MSDAPPETPRTQNLGAPVAGDPAPTETRVGGWRPTGSTNASVIGGAAATLICSAWNSFLPAHQMGVMEAGAVVTLCTALANYFHPDGGRR